MREHRDAEGIRFLIFILCEWRDLPQPAYSGLAPSLQRRGIKGVVGMSNYKTSPSPPSAGLPPPL